MSLDTLEPASATMRAAQTEIPLWPEGPPHSDAIGPGPEQVLRQGVPGRETDMLRNVAVPTLTVYRPDAAKANDVGVIVCPGGGWRILAWEHEGTELCQWLTARGYTAFLLKYRLMGTPPDPADYARMMADMTARLTTRFDSEKPPRRFGDLLRDEKATKAREAAAEDGRRALALVRERAGEWGVKADRIGMVGFSAGAFLVGDVAMDPGGAPLAFVAPIYGGDTHGRPVSADAPPLFTTVARDDRLLFRVVEQLYFDWSEAGRPAEIHVFNRGAHGFGMATQSLPSDRWIDLMGDWLADLGYA